MVCETVLLGGGNAKLMKDLPNHVILGANSNAIDGGIKLWQDVDPELADHRPDKRSSTKQTPKT